MHLMSFVCTSTYISISKHTNACTHVLYTDTQSKQSGRGRIEATTTTANIVGHRCLYRHTLTVKSKTIPIDACLEGMSVSVVCGSLNCNYVLVYQIVVFCCVVVNDRNKRKHKQTNAQHTENTSKPFSLNKMYV